MPDRIRAIIIKGKKMLLVTGATGEFYWTPGGRQERGETHEQTLRRELLEEVNLNLESMNFISLIERRDPSGNVSRQHYYLCTVGGEPKPGKEIKAFSWFSFEDYKQRRLSKLDKIDGMLQSQLDVISDKLHTEGLI